jgi:hypothetical protein
VSVDDCGAEAPGLRYELDRRPTLVRGDPDALERAIGNLVDNALKWSPLDGRVLISTAARTAQGAGIVKFVTAATDFSPRSGRSGDGAPVPGGRSLDQPQARCR